MPDLHPGKYGPVGCAILAERVHPEFVGSDIGCGMALFAFDESARKLRLDKAADRLRILGEPWDGDAVARVEEAGLAEAGFAASLGTIGGGNHFCEVQAVARSSTPRRRRTRASKGTRCACSSIPVRAASARRSCWTGSRAGS